MCCILGKIYNVYSNPWLCLMKKISIITRALNSINRTRVLFAVRLQIKYAISNTTPKLLLLSHNWADLDKHIATKNGKSYGSEGIHLASLLCTQEDAVVLVYCSIMFCSLTLILYHNVFMECHSTSCVTYLP